MRVLFVANGGGHLNELFHLSKRLPFQVDESTWVTIDSMQSRSLLDGEEVHFVRYASPRNVSITAANLVTAAKLLRQDRFDVVFSTGASVAISFLPLAALLGIPCYYIESAARSDGPSLTGRILRWIPSIRLYTQHRSWASRRWTYVGSVFDQFETATKTHASPIRKVVVTVGVTESYGFERLIRALVSLLPPDADVLWQTGCTTVDELGLDTRQQVPALELEAAMREADLVVSHAGVGSALSALDSGRIPVIVPRELRYGEHIDDHQIQEANELTRRNLAVSRRVNELRREDLETAARSQAQKVPYPGPIGIEVPVIRRGRRKLAQHGRQSSSGRTAFIAWGVMPGRPIELGASLDADVLSCFPPGTKRRLPATIRYIINTCWTVYYLIRNRPGAVIVTNPPIIPVTIAITYGRLTGRAVVIDDHPAGFGAQNYRIGARLTPLHRRLVPLARLCLVTDQSWVALVEEWGGRGLVFHEAPGDWVPSPTRLPNRSDRAPRVMFACTFAKDEPAADVVEAAAKLPDVQFVITGELKRSVKLEHGPNVLFSGFLSPASYRLAVEQADVVIALTTDPTSAMRAAFEAVWAEKVLVVTDWPLLRELFPNALHVDNTADSIAEGVRKAVNEHGRLQELAPESRQLQLTRWEGQISALREVLDEPTHIGSASDMGTR